VTTLATGRNWHLSRPASQMRARSAPGGLPGLHRAGPSTPLDEQCSVVPADTTAKRADQVITIGNQHPNSRKAGIESGRTTDSDDNSDNAAVCGPDRTGFDKDFTTRKRRADEVSHVSR
jgi:hypothetical protein